MVNARKAEAAPKINQQLIKSILFLGAKAGAHVEANKGLLLEGVLKAKAACVLQEQLDVPSGCVLEVRAD